MPEPASEWVTSITRVEPGLVEVRGQDIGGLIREGTFTEGLWLVLTGQAPAPGTVRVVDAVLAACVDHGLASTATVSARYVMSGSGAMTAAMATGLLAFGQHTGTSNLTAEWLLALAGSVDPDAVSDDDIRAVVKRDRAQRRAVPGFGHPVHKEGDPRTSALRDVVDQAGVAGAHARLLDRVHIAVEQELGRSLVMNVDGLIGAVLTDLGLGPDQILAVNLIGALPGIAAHAAEERAGGRHLRVPPPNAVRFDPR